MAAHGGEGDVIEEADGYVTQSPDTSREVETRLVERWRALTPAERLAMMSDLQRSTDLFAVSGIQLRHPAATEREVRLRLAALKYGREFVLQQFGWDPDQHGW